MPVRESAGGFTTEAGQMIIIKILKDNQITDSGKITVGNNLLTKSSDIIPTPEFIEELKALQDHQSIGSLIGRTIENFQRRQREDKDAE